MNKERRKRISDALTKLEDLKTEIEDIKNEEEDYHSNMPDSIREGEKGEAAQTAVDSLDEAYNALCEAEGSLTTASEQ